MDAHGQVVGGLKSAILCGHLKWMTPENDISTRRFRFLFFNETFDTIFVRLDYDRIVSIILLQLDHHIKFW